MTSSALVTGASSGIGEATCRLLLEQNYRVVGAARNLARLEAMQTELGENFHAARLDVTDPGSVDALLPGLPDRFREIGVLVNNAGHDVGGRREFAAGTAEQWCDIIDTNVQGLIRVSHAIIHGMLERGSGHIVNLGSNAGLNPYATMTAYVASKYAVHGFSDSLRLDYAGRGIRVTEIMPGLVRTNFARERLGDAQKAEAFYASYAQTLLPEDVGRTILYALQQPPHVEIAQLVVLPMA